MTIGIFLTGLPSADKTLISGAYTYVVILIYGWLRFDFRQRQETFLYSTATRPNLEPTKPIIQWVKGVFSPGVKQTEREYDHSPQSNAEVRNGGAIPPVFHTSSWHKDNFTFYSVVLTQVSRDLG
jgi:hypothetical protein